ncbi:MAG TPA: bifunctional DedA family/phosphatase PAP2 family protein, partial [Gammaproteobacteria bacterium]
MDALLAWITAHPHWAGLAVWLVAFSESLAIVGLFMPGALLLFGIGTLVGLGHLELWPTLAWAFAGAVLGDGLSFWIGRHYRQQLRTLWPFRNYPRLVNRGVDFFHRHGGKSVLFGRFVGPVRPIVPAVAGMLEMPVGRYLAINLGSALAWAPAYLLPGVVFGASLELAAAVTGRLAALLLLSLALGWLVLVAARLLLRLLQPRARQLVEGLLAWGHHHPRFAALAAAVGDPGGPEARGLAVLAGALVALFALAALAVEAVAGLPLAWDPWLHELLAALRNPLADRLLIGVSQLGDSLFLGIYSAAVFAWLVARRERGLALHWLAVVGFAWLAPELLKHGFQVGRPAPHDAGGDGFSFPSGHAVGATAVYGFVAVVLARALAPAWRWLPYGGAAVLVTGIAFSRVYLGMHWPTDVAAGVLLGGAWVVLLGTAYRVRPFPQPAGRALAALLLGLPLLLALAYLPLRA